MRMHNIGKGWKTDFSIKININYNNCFVKVFRQLNDDIFVDALWHKVKYQQGIGAGMLNGN